MNNALGAYMYDICSREDFKKFMNNLLTLDAVGIFIKYITRLGEISVVEKIPSIVLKGR